MAEEKREEYSSIHDGPSIDNAVARALPGSAIDASIQAKPNPNLLDNWHFGNSVNQRGQTEYTGAGYTIDRWKIGSGEKLTVLDEFCRVECTATSGRSFAQILDANLAGKNVTFSVLVKAISNIAVAYVSNSSGSTIKSMSITGPGLWSITVTIPYDVTDLLVQVNPTVVGDTVDIIAAKLELGSQQTLAHQDADGNWVLNEMPNYADTLSRCQRYVRPGPTTFIVSGPINGSYYASSSGDFPQMRDIPVSLTNLVGLEVNDITGRTIGVTINTAYNFTNKCGITIRLSGDPGTACITIPTGYLISCDL